MNEQISALVDGEASEFDRERVLRAMQSDPALRNTWERYHLASTAIRRELDLVVDSTLAIRIQDRLRNETQESRHFRLPGAMKLAAGLAIAASVATVAILNLSPLASPSSSSTVAKSPASAPGIPVASARQTPDPQQALNPYLVHHGDVAPAAGMNGLLSYVRVVGYGGTSIEGKEGNNGE